MRIDGVSTTIVDVDSTYVGEEPIEKTEVSEEISHPEAKDGG